MQNLLLGSLMGQQEKHIQKQLGKFMEELFFWSAICQGLGTR